MQIKINFVVFNFKLFCLIFAIYYHHFMHFDLFIISYNFIKKYSAKYYYCLQFKINIANFELKLFFCRIFAVYYHHFMHFICLIIA